MYARSCAACHGGELQGATSSALASAEFRARWSSAERSLDDLYTLIRTAMPPGQQGSLTNDQYLAVTAYLLERNGVPAGAQRLIADRTLLARTRIPAMASATGSATADTATVTTPWDIKRIVPDYQEGPRGRTPTGVGPSQAELLAAESGSRDWLVHGHDLAGTRYSALRQVTTRNANRLRVACSFQVGEGGSFQPGPIVHQGTMYLTTTWSTIALDAADGKLLWSRRIADANIGERITMPPIIHDDLIYIGPAVSENAIRGWVGAFRLDDGAPVWRFNIVPGPGEPGYETWRHDMPFPIGGGGVWTPFAIDAARGLLHVAATNPAPDFPEELRGGINLYTNSALALDLQTGRLVWYEQMVPNDDHDWDFTQIAPLYRAPVTQQGTHACPGVLGGVEWNGPAYHPGANVLVTPAVDWCSTFFEAAADSIKFVPGQNYLGGTIVPDSVSQGWLTAVDASTGQVRWRYRSARPMVAAVTATGGELIFAGELNGDLIALDAATGDVRSRHNTGGSVGVGIVTYDVGGTQYIAVASGRPSGFWIDAFPGAATITVFALDGGPSMRR